MRVLIILKNLKKKKQTRDCSSHSAGEEVVGVIMIGEKFLSMCVLI